MAALTDVPDIESSVPGVDDVLVVPLLEPSDSV
jgi:hypothetical protein